MSRFDCGKPECTFCKPVKKSPWHHAPTEHPPTNKYVIIRMRDGATWVGKFGYHGKAHKQQWSAGGFRLYTEDILWWMNAEDLPATPGIPT